MRSRSSANEQVAEVARRRLELLGEELAGIRRDLPTPRTAGPDGPGERSPEPDQRAEPARPPERPPVAGRHAKRSLRGSEVIAGWLHDRLPPTLQGRVQLGSSHLTVVAVLVAAALAVTAWWVVRADGPGTVLPASAAHPPGDGGSPLVALPGPGSTGGASPGSPPDPGGSAAPGAAPATGTGKPTPSGQVVVDVAGKVRRPGIATLPAGARVVDAVKAAGGVRRGATLHGLNLARVLVDGEQVLVGVPPPGGVAAPAASAPSSAGSAPTALVNINSADQTELETLPGVGPVTAQAILQWRADNGAFTAVDELLEVSGIGDATLAEMAPFVTL